MFAASEPTIEAADTLVSTVIIVIVPNEAV
jgi:hypothetical protein